MRVRGVDVGSGVEVARRVAGRGAVDPGLLWGGDRGRRLEHGDAAEEIRIVPGGDDRGWVQRETCGDRSSGCPPLRRSRGSGRGRPPCWPVSSKTCGWAVTNRIGIGSVSVTVSPGDQSARSWRRSPGTGPRRCHLPLTAMRAPASHHAGMRRKRAKSPVAST